MTDIPRSQLNYIMRIKSFSDGMGQDCFDLYGYAPLPKTIIVHKQGVAAGYEIDEYSYFDLKKKNAKIYKAILDDESNQSRYSLISKIQMFSISIDTNN